MKTKRIVDRFESAPKPKQQMEPPANPHLTSGPSRAYYMTRLSTGEIVEMIGCFSHYYLPAGTWRRDQRMEVAYSAIAAMGLPRGSASPRRDEGRGEK